MTVNQGKRNADSANLPEPELTTVTKVTKYVSQLASPFNSLSSYPRVAKSSSPRSHQDIAPSKPSGFTGAARTATAHPTVATVDEDDEPSMPTEDEEAADDLEFSNGSNDSLVRPLTSCTYIKLTTPPHRSASRPQ